MAALAGQGLNLRKFAVESLESYSSLHAKLNGKKKVSNIWIIEKSAVLEHLTGKTWTDCANYIMRGLT
jgi:hypothetical protein